MSTRNVVLTDQQEIFLGRMVSAGRYQNASEVLRDGLRLLEDQVQRREEELTSIRKGVIAGMEQIERGDFSEGSGNQAIESAFNCAKKQRSL